MDVTPQYPAAHAPGYWIADCAKMRYKGEYAPSYLLDAGTQQFHLLTSKLDTFLQSHKGYTPFADVEAMSAEDVKAAAKEAAVVNGNGAASAQDHIMEENGASADEDEESDSDEDEDEDDDALYPTPPPPGMLDPATLSAELLGSLVVFTDTGSGLGLVPYAVSASDWPR